MNNDEPDLYPEELPDWAWEIIDKHDLALRADTPIASATVLLLDAANKLKEISTAAFRRQAFSEEFKRHIFNCEAMIADAVKLYPLCPTRSDGRYIERDDGLLEWRPDLAQS